MRKIRETRQFFKVGGPQGHFFEKTKKKTVLRCGLGECVSLSFFVWPGGVTHINKYTNKEKHTHIYK